MKLVLLLALLLTGCASNDRDDSSIALYNCTTRAKQADINLRYNTYCAVRNRECALMVVHSMMMECMLKTYFK